MGRWVEFTLPWVSGLPDLPDNLAVVNLSGIRVDEERCEVAFNLDVFQDPICIQQVLDGQISRIIFFAMQPEDKIIVSVTWSLTGHCEMEVMDLPEEECSFAMGSATHASYARRESGPSSDLKDYDDPEVSVDDMRKMVRSGMIRGKIGRAHV